MTQPAEILFVDDEEHLRRSAVQMFDLAGLRARSFSSAEDVLPLISRDLHAVLVTDIRMRGQSGMDLLTHAIEVDPDLPVVLVTGHGDVALAVEAMQRGAYDFIEKPFASERLLDSVSRGLEKRRLTLEVRNLRDTIAGRWDNLEARLIGRSDAMLAIRNQIRAIAPVNTNVLVTGDTGTGKEVVARAIHDLSHGTERPFVAINCAALPANMIEADLFGYEAGAFPGAVRARFGKLEHGRNGTIFFDGVDMLPLDVQATLVRIIDENRITRLGSNEPIDLNARFIASSALDLEVVAEAQKFRRDLLYQLAVVTLNLPNLAERAEDIPTLFVMLTRDAAARHRVSPPDVPQRLLDRLRNAHWPGNVRELRNAAERLVLGIDQSDAVEIGAGSLSDRVATYERQLIEAGLAAHNGRLKPTYEALGLSRKTLYEKMQKHGLNRDDFRD